MNTALPGPNATPSFARRLFNRYTLLAFVAGTSLTIGVGALAVEGAWHHGMMMLHGPHSAAEISAHVDHGLKHLYAEIDATDAQKAQIDPLVKQAVNDLVALHSQLDGAHGRFVQALLQTPVDRTALEAARASHIQFADQASKRIVQLIADVGDVLTPEQRKGLAAHLQKLHGATPEAPAG
jgi:Spy/CpxP family protein refolding chaperone